MAGLLHSLFVKFMRTQGKNGTDPFSTGLASGKVTRENPTDKSKSKYGISESAFGGYRVFTYGTPIDGQPILYYLHGGGFVLGLTHIHFDPIGKLHKSANLPIIAPDFPLPPETDANGVVEFNCKHFREMLAKYPNSPFIVFGDSAGGNLSLSLVQALSREERARINSVFLLFSVLDMRKDEADYNFYKEEALLTLETTKIATPHWIGTGSPDDPVISPILGELSNLPPLHIYSADKDPLYGHSIDLETVMKMHAYPHSHFIFSGYGHDFIFFPTPDASKGIKRIVSHMHDSLSR